jgi:CRISPR-associated protein Cas2
MVMRAKKDFIVVAYDIKDDKRRNRVVKALTKVGVRINFSVFECMMTSTRFRKLQDELAEVIDPAEDCVVYYPICVKCYTRIIYQPERHRSFDPVVVL